MQLQIVVHLVHFGRAQAQEVRVQPAHPLISLFRKGLYISHCRGVRKRPVRDSTYAAMGPLERGSPMTTTRSLFCSLAISVPFRRYTSSIARR